MKHEEYRQPTEEEIKAAHKRWFQSRFDQGWAEGIEIAAFIKGILSSGVAFTTTEIKDLVVMKQDADRQIQLVSMQGECTCERDDEDDDL